MKLLVVIPNYGTKNDGYLSRVLSEYRSVSYQTDIVVLTNIKKNFGPDVEVVIGLPSKNPREFPFGHKRIFAERKDAYDLFVYGEDDILITQRNIESFRRVTSILPEQELAGFFRWEQYPNGTRFYPDAHAGARWLPESVQVISGHTFARFTNVQSSCYALTRGQLAQVIASGGFLVPPHQHKYALIETAATDPYTQCGFRKLICVSHFEDFLVAHLPNNYVGTRIGVDAVEFDNERDALLHPRQSGRPSHPLLETETQVFHCDWSKDRYEPCRADLIERFPASTRTLLSIGSGWGKTEAELAKKGIEVIAIPVDSLIAACAEARGVKVVHDGLESAMERLRGQQFDGVLMSGILHLLPDPAKLVRDASFLLAEGGVLVATIPAFNRLPSRWRRLQYRSGYKGWREFQRSGVQAIGRRNVRMWFRKAELSVERITSTIPKRWKTLAAVAHPLAHEFFASEYTLVGLKKRHIATVTTRLLAPHFRVEPEVPVSADGKSHR